MLGELPATLVVAWPDAAAKGDDHYSGRMQIVVNGEAKELGPGCSVQRLLSEMRLEGKPCAVEVNKAVVPKREHGARVLEQGDRVEIVTLVGGG